MNLPPLPDTYPEQRTYIGHVNQLGANNLQYEILTDQPHTLFHLVLGSILENLKVQNEILAFDEDPSIATVAWAGRNTMELSILSRYGCRSARNLQRFHADSLVIGSMMLKGVIQIQNDWARELGKKQVPPSSHRTQAEVQEARESAGLKHEQPLMAKTCARSVGMEKEYEAFSRFTSPLVHPSAVMVLKSFDLESCRQALVIHGLKLGSDIILDIRGHMARHGCKPMAGELAPL